MKRFSLFLASALAFQSCTKDQQGETFCLDGVVHWAGEPAADGLGWVILKDDSTAFKPYVVRNLADSFKVDGQKVAVCMYQTSEKFYCECVRPLDKYHINSIKRR